MTYRWLAALLPLTLLLQTACGRETKIYADPVKADITNTTDGRAFLPAGFYNQSVNRASVELIPQSSEPALHFQTTDEGSAAGAFNEASATGNRALLGLSAFDKTKLVDLKSIAIDSKLETGELGVDLVLIADLKCDGTSVHALIARATDFASSKESSSFSGFSRFTAKSAEAHWRSGSADINDGADTLLAKDSAKSLTNLLAKYPDACIRNLASGDDGLPKSLPTAGLLLAVGDNSTKKLTSVFVKRLAVESSVTTEVFSSADWSLNGMK